MGTLLFIDKITILNFAFILYLGLRNKQLKIICGSLPSKRPLFRRFENYLLKHYDISFVFYDHLDLHGFNIPEVLINRFGELKDNINERSYICCEELFNQKIAPSKNYKNILKFLKGDNRVNNFIKKELLVNYCKKYINLFECASLIICDLKENHNVFFILSSDSLGLWNIYNRHFRPFNIPPKLLLKGLSDFIDGLFSVLAGPSVLGLILYRSFKRICFHAVKDPRGQKVIWIAAGIDYDFLTNLFRETTPFDSSFFVEQALFVMESPDTGQMEKYCLEHNIQSAIPEQVPISFGYFLKRILGNICGSFLVKQLLLSFLGRGKLVFWKINYSLIKNIIDYESLCEIYPVKLFLISRYYEPRNAIKTIVINKYGGKTISFQFGEIAHPMFSAFLYAYCAVNHFFLYGEGTGEFQKCGHQINEFHIIGSDRVDSSIRFKEKSEVLREKLGLDTSFVITVFGPAYNETIPRKRNVLKFYQAVFFAFSEVIDRDITLVIKAHKKSNMQEGETDFPELAGLIDLFRNHKNVRYYYYENPYELMTVADFVIVWSTSTTGIESIASGKRTVFFDPMKSRFHTYKNYHDKIVISDQRDLADILESAINKNFPISDEVYEFIRRKHCYPNDGLSIQRLLNKLSEVI